MKNVLGVFCNSDVSNNEELKAQLRKKNVFMVLLLIISGLAMLGLIIYESNGGEYVGDKNGWFYRGACTGIAFAAVVFLFRNLNTIKDEKKLTELRIEITDERNIAINAAAVRAALAVMFAAMFVIMLSSGFVLLDVYTALVFLFALFMVSYAAAYRRYSEKM